MKAIRLNGQGEVDVMTYADVPAPVAGDGKVVVEIAAAGVNFLDIGVRKGHVRGGLEWTILGVEGAGRVAEVGQGVSGLEIGQRVAWAFAPSSYAQRVLVSAESLVPIPDEIDDRTAAAVMMQGLTASHFATDFYPVQRGDVALVHAAAGGVGLLLTQIIKLRGGTVIGRVSSADKVRAVRAAGADHVIVDSVGGFAAEVMRCTDGRGVDVVYDGSGPTTFQGSLDSLRRSGTLAWFGPVLGKPEPIDLTSLPRSIKIGYAVYADHVPTPERLRAAAAQLFAWVESGELNVNIGGVYDLADAAQAHTDMEQRRTTGKLLLIP